MRNAVPMRAGCRAWIKDGKEAQEEAQRRALREREMPWKTLWIRCGPQPLGTEKHDPGQQVCPRELCPHGTVQIAYDRAYRFIPSLIQCWFHPACLPSLYTPRPQDSLIRQLSCARPVSHAIIHLAEIPVIFRTLWKTRRLENAQPRSADALSFPA